MQFYFLLTLKSQQNVVVKHVGSGAVSWLSHSLGSTFTVQPWDSKLTPVTPLPYKSYGAIILQFQMFLWKLDELIYMKYLELCLAHSKLVKWQLFFLILSKDWQFCLHG